MITDKLKATACAVIAVLCMLITLYQTSRLVSIKTEFQKAQLEWQTERTELATQLAKEQAKVRTAEQKLQTDVDNARKETRDEINKLNTDRDALIKRLRQSQRGIIIGSAGVSGSAQAAGDGKAAGLDVATELLATLGEEDVDEASRADTIRIALNACYRQYEAARAVINR